MCIRIGYMMRTILFISKSLLYESNRGLLIETNINIHKLYGFERAFWMSLNPFLNYLSSI